MDSGTGGVMVMVREAWSMPVTDPVRMVTPSRLRRWEATTWRGWMEPAATSGRKDW